MKKRRGEEAIALARSSLAMHIQVYGAVSSEVASTMVTLANIFCYFFTVDDEVLRLLQQAIIIHTRVHGSTSLYVAAGEDNLGGAYSGRAKTANDLDRAQANLELALPHFRESARIYTAINHVGKADDTRNKAAAVEEDIRQIVVLRAAKAAVAAAAAAASRG